MSDRPQTNHQTTIIPHDHAHCHTARTSVKGDCGTRYEVHCSCGWGTGADSRARADERAVGHRIYEPDAPVIRIDILQDEITDDQLRELFARHCECRPLDLTRNEADHAACHDCDTGILHDIQVGLGIARSNDGCIQSMREARGRCAQQLRWKRDIR